VAIDLAPREIRIAPRAEIVAIGKRRHGAFERQDMQSMSRQLEVADDLRAQQAHDVGKHREGETRKDLLAHRGATENRATLEHEHLASGAREVGGIDEAVVATADHDRIPVLRAGHVAFLRGGSKNGSLRTQALARLR
jgi:hypothetical protein